MADDRHEEDRARVHRPLDYQDQASQDHQAGAVTVSADLHEPNPHSHLSAGPEQAFEIIRNLSRDPASVRRPAEINN